MSLIERCAGAILADYERQAASGEMVHRENGDVQVNASALVRAVLKEMLEPLEGNVVEMGAISLFQYPEIIPLEAQAEQIAWGVFETMIKTALNED